MPLGQTLGKALNKSLVSRYICNAAQLGTMIPNVEKNEQMMALRRMPLSALQATPFFST